MIYRILLIIFMEMVSKWQLLFTKSTATFTKPKSDWQYFSSTKAVQIRKCSWRARK